MQYWNSNDFKKISAINSKNRMSSNNGECPSLYTGGSVAFAEYRRRHNTFTNTIKDKVGETSTLRNEEGLEVDDGDMERNTTTNGEDEGEKTSEDDVNLLKTVSEEQLLKLG
ncbi:hypothetical protein AABB24_028079 [Solanum stoloniferum]|uniref:Uncharacterized protein n=1 Tax=Solanum stoloniferum TaxID=62892 RepID=A0ABD2S4Y0_9SOLN